MRKYKTFDHTADIGIEIIGKTRKELFGNAVAAIFDVMVDWPSEDKRLFSVDEIKPLEEKRIKITGNDLEDTLINFLRETLYLFNGKCWLIRSCEPLKLTKRSIVARLQGEPYNRQKNPLKTEIKAVTYHGLIINKSKKCWQAKVVFDV
jgi:SHS2 domain-containing protein